MNQKPISPEILDKIKKLEEKFSAMGQDISSYLDGLLYADYLTYWDYIHLDTLLSLQNPKTAIPDEKIFIAYHQVTELYFQMIIWEIEQIAEDNGKSTKLFLDKIKRINRYFEHLVSSFDIMVDGMEQAQFMKFRMALLPASGFQSAQYRLIEIMATDFKYLVGADFRAQINAESSVESMYENIYWKKGATELSTGNKTLTLKQFESKYTAKIIETAIKYKASNLWKTYSAKLESDELKYEITKELKFFDLQVNVNWPLAHYKSAVRYLQKDPEVIAATGGTNWQKYLPPRFQKRIFYPELWSDAEKENWGKSWVLKEVFNKETAN